MKNSISFYSLFLLLLSCSVNTDRKIEQEQLSFSYSDDAYIFFRNMRQTYYQLRVLKESAWRIYTHEDYEKKQAFTTSIVVDWKNNKAYPVLNLSNSINTGPLTIEIYNQENNNVSQLKLKKKRRRDELKFLTDLYNIMLNEDVEFYRVSDSAKIPLFENNDHREAFRISMYDFYRLTAAL